jgi:type II secretory ATPase GspE/PulE/Tfp pilus assembly ATPase PilB-like protein
MVMANTQTMEQGELKIKIKEAETCYSMGLIEEALSAYERILSDTAGQEKQIHPTIRHKISQLKKEMADQKAVESQGISAEDISIFKKTLSASEDVTTILDGARALKELGLLEEAVAEYEKLLDFDFSKSDYTKFDYSPAKIIQDFLICVSEIKSPQEVVKLACEAIDKHALKDPEIARLQFWLGTRMEKKSQIDLAVELYRKASERDPNNTDITNNFSRLSSEISSGSRYDYLLSNKLVTTNQLQDALAISKKINKSVEYVLIDRFKVNKDAVGKSLSLFFGCPFRSFDREIPVPIELVSKLKKSFLLYYVWVPLGWDKTGIEILVDDPKDLRKTDHIKALMTNQKINFAVGIKEDVDNFINYFFDPRIEKITDNVYEQLDDIIPDITFEDEEEIEDYLPVMDESSSQIVKFVDQVLVTAFRNNVSDIHIEPSPITRKTTIRFRSDGVCHEYIQVPNSMAPAITSRLKIMADLDIAEKRLPQDGKIKVKRKGIKEFELRVSTMPTDGRFEDTVLRILTRTHTIKLEDIGLNDRNLEVLIKLINRPYGMILCVGPTGSGKTTTLHAALASINRPEVKIWTAEDLVEITQAGLRQVQVKPKIGLDFARIMRGFLRLDPDIIMIGEMRDRETASIGIEASLTGHLVFSTLHTNNAPETLTRLLDMGINPLNISDAFLGVLAQRLVRRLCKDCIESYHPSEEEFEDIRTDYGEAAFKATQIEYNSSFKLHRAAGCEKCSGSGYKGRLGIHELIEGTPEIKLLIKRQATSHDLGKQARKQGMITLKKDGIHKVFDGITDIREVRRVCVE